MQTLLLLCILGAATSCGIAPIAANASCCECAGYDGDAHACHWCPAPVGGCKYFGSNEYRCPGFIVQRSDCPGVPCPPINVSPTPTPSRGGSPSRTPSPTPTRASPSPSPAPPAPLRPFSKKGVGYYGGNCSDLAVLSNLSWFYDWGHDQESLVRSNCPTGQGSNHAVNGVEWVPMIWGKYALKNISQMNTTFIAGARYIFSFNEPCRGSRALASNGRAGVCIQPNYRRSMRVKLRKRSMVAFGMEQGLRQCHRKGLSV